MAVTGTKKKLGKGRHASCFKRQRQNKKRRAANKFKRTALKNAIKSLKQKPNNDNLKTAVSSLAKAGRKHLIHPRKAARLISRLTKSVNRASR